MARAGLVEKGEAEKIHSIAPESGAAADAGQAIISEIRGLEILNEGTYAVDLEKTISDMLDVIKRMESQLESVLNLNAKLENDLDASKELVVDLDSEKRELQAKISRMEEEIPSKRELLLEIDELIEERNDAQIRIQSNKRGMKKLEQEMERSSKRIRSLKEDKKDIIIEMDFVEAKLKATLAKNNTYKNEIDALRGERLTLLEKVGHLESELKDAAKEKFRLFQELKAHSETVGASL